MSKEGTGQQNAAKSEDTGQNPERTGQLAEKPEVDESHRQAAKEMAKAYDDVPTAVLPGSHGTISGTAINAWLDDEGNPKFGKAEEKADSGSNSGSATPKIPPH